MMNTESQLNIKIDGDKAEAFQQGRAVDWSLSKVTLLDLSLKMGGSKNG
jgi:hypothetical protein